MSRPADASPRVDLPPPSKDRALSSKVGLIAAAGFALGVAWPRLLGIEVGPDVPGGPAPRPAASAPLKEHAAAAPGSAAPDLSAEIEEGPSNKQLAVVSDGVVRSCKNKKGDKLDECGKLAVDKILKPKLAELADCPAALGLEGKLKVGVAINFEKSEITIVDDEKSELPSSTVKGVFACAAGELKAVELDKIPHTHPRYTVVYDVAFHPPGKAPPPEGDKEPEGAAAGADRATVRWEKALIRESPKDGNIVARIPQGTRVTVLEQNDDWYLVESGKSKGWVYRQAIGR